MTKLNIEEIRRYANNLKNYNENECPADQCIIIEFEQNNKNNITEKPKIQIKSKNSDCKKISGDDVIDELMINKTLYLHAKDENVMIDFDDSGLVKRIEICIF